MYETIETEVRERAGGAAYITSIVGEDFEVPECVIKKKITDGEKKTSNQMAYFPSINRKSLPSI